MPAFQKFNRGPASRRPGARNAAAGAGLVLALGLAWQGAAGALAASPTAAPGASANPVGPTGAARLDPVAAGAPPQRQDLGPSVAAALARLVSAGTISQAQSAAIWQAQLGRSALDLRALVAAGAITDAQAAAVGTTLDQVKRRARPSGTQAPDVALPTKPVAPAGTRAPEVPLPTKPLAPSTTAAPDQPAPAKP